MNKSFRFLRIQVYPFAFLVFFFTVSLPVFPACIKSSESQKWAVIVGSGEIENSAFETSYADNDALAFYSQLKPVLGNEHIYLLLGANATKLNIRAAITDWLAMREDVNDVVLVFISSHGNGDYLRVFDSLKSSFTNDISSTDLNEWLNTLESKNMVLIFDACESGYFANNISGNSRVILASSTGREKSWQLDIYEHGLFTYYLIDALEHQRSVDANHDGFVSAEELFSSTKRKVENEFEQYPPPSPQQPSISDNHEGQLILFRSK